MNNDPEKSYNFGADLRRRISQTKTTRWIRFAIVSVIFLLWVAWLGNWWVALFLFLLFDIYITGFIPLTWWKKSKSAAVRAVMSWVDAILYALVLVYFIFTFVGQNYQIPSSSLEKSLLVGDYLWVNKMAYGPRVPNTPIHFPLVQNTLPWLETKSYVDWPQWKYHRLRGFGNAASATSCRRHRGAEDAEPRLLQRGLRYRGFRPPRREPTFPAHALKTPTTA